MDPLFVTTAIPFVNARPHVGFVYEALLADVLARHARLRGREVRFQSGTDENSLKNVLAAERLGVSTRELVDRNAAHFADLAPASHLSWDRFVRTSVDPVHRATVERVFRACAHDLERRVYRGRYCNGCERFLDDPDCEEHPGAVESIEEENWYFALSRHRARIQDAIERGELVILPESARQETLAWLDRARDVSVSRPRERARGWGIPVPDDASQIVWVWFDALLNYVAGAGDLWTERTERVHVIGKGVTRFHTVIFPAILASAGLALPTKILVHGHLTVDGRKIAKSGATIDPLPLLERYAVDAVRWYLLRAVRTGRDADFRESELVARNDAELANAIGNLVSRVDTLSKKVGLREVPPDDGTLAARIDEALARFAVDEAAAAIHDAAIDANRTLDRDAPWSAIRRGDEATARATLLRLRAKVGAIARELAPFAPSGAAAIAARLRGEGEGPIFPRLNATERVLPRV